MALSFLFRDELFDLFLSLRRGTITVVTSSIQLLSTMLTVSSSSSEATSSLSSKASSLSLSCYVTEMVTKHTDGKIAIVFIKKRGGNFTITFVVGGGKK